MVPRTQISKHLWLYNYLKAYNEKLAHIKEKEKKKKKLK